MELLLSGRLEDVISNPEYGYQLSSFDPKEENLFEKIEELGGLPDNVKVFHAPIMMWTSKLRWFIHNVEQWMKEPVIVFHPNKKVIPYFEDHKIVKPESSLYCFENFPWQSKKPLRTPQDILAWTSTNGFDVCYDYAHTNSGSIYRTFEFLISYLPYVSVIHFSGEGHTKLTEDDWKLWERLISDETIPMRNIRYMVMEHIEYQDKIKDMNRLNKILERRFSK